ncbi:MAG: darcynin [Rubritepida sp.]|jgi:hypothetical protein|nr:darcynin [Rubritepida sp.]
MFDIRLTHSIFMLVKTTPEWLALPPPGRFAFLREAIEPILRANPAVRLRFFDAEGFNARVSDVALWETEDLGAYHRVVEALRETPFWDRYFLVQEIVPAVENAYARHYGEAPVGA